MCFNSFLTALLQESRSESESERLRKTSSLSLQLLLPARTRARAEAQGPPKGCLDQGGGGGVATKAAENHAQR